MKSAGVCGVYKWMWEDEKTQCSCQDSEQCVSDGSESTIGRGGFGNLREHTFDCPRNNVQNSRCTQLQKCFQKKLGNRPQNCTEKFIHVVSIGT